MRHLGGKPQDRRDRDLIQQGFDLPFDQQVPSQCELLRQQHQQRLSQRDHLVDTDSAGVRTDQSVLQVGPAFNHSYLRPSFLIVTPRKFQLPQLADRQMGTRDCQSEPAHLQGPHLVQNLHDEVRQKQHQLRLGQVHRLQPNAMVIIALLFVFPLSEINYDLRCAAGESPSGSSRLIDSEVKINSNAHFHPSI